MKNKTADLLYEQTLETTAEEVAQASLLIMSAIQTKKVCNQMLGLAAALICMLHHYGLNHTDVLGIADNIVYSGANNNMKPEFKVIRKYMKDEWEL